MKRIAALVLALVLCGAWALAEGGISMKDRGAPLLGGLIGSLMGEQPEGSEDEADGEEDGYVVEAPGEEYGDPGEEYEDQGDEYDAYGGDALAEDGLEESEVMVVVNCQEWVSLRAQPNTSSRRLAQVPLGAQVTDCEESANGFIACQYQGLPGFILGAYLRPAGEDSGEWEEEGPEDATLQMVVVNCQEWVSLRAQPARNAQRLAQVPLGAVVSDCRMGFGEFTACEYQGLSGYILSAYLAPAEGDYEGDEYGEEDGYEDQGGEAAPEDDGDEADTASFVRGGVRLETSRAFGDGEHLSVACMDANTGAELWTRTISGEPTELTCTAAFLAGTEDAPLVMLYTTGDGLSCCDSATGEVLWTLPRDEVNLGAGISWAVDEDGTMYIGGYYGPDPVAISADGRVLWQADAESDDTYWLYEIELQEDCVAAHYDMLIDQEPGWVYYSYDGEMLGIERD